MLSRAAFLEHLWSDVIRPEEREAFIDALRGAKSNAGARLTNSASRAVSKMIKAGIPRQAIADLVEWASYEAVFAVLYALEEPGVRATKGLYEDLLSFAPASPDDRK